MNARNLSTSGMLPACYFCNIQETIIVEKDSMKKTLSAIQIIGTLGEWAMGDNFYDAVQDFRIGLPGMALQIVGGYLFIKYVIRK